MSPAAPSRDLLRKLGNLLLVLGLLGLLVWALREQSQQEERSVEAQGSTVPGGILVFAPSYEARLEAALERAPRAELGEEARADVEKRGGEALADAPSRVQGWPEAVPLSGLLDAAELRELLLSQDEEAAARWLREHGVTTLALHWRLSPSIDRDHRVLSRLYHHDGLEWFGLYRVTDQLFLYRVRRGPPSFPPEVAAAAVQGLRSLLSGGSLPDLSGLEGVKGKTWELMALVRGQGRALAIGLSRHRDFAALLRELADDLERGHRRYAEWWGFPPLAQHVRQLSIELFRVVESAEVEPRDDATLRALWELGIDGVIMRDYANHKGAMFPGSIAYTRSIRDAPTFLARAAKFHNMPDRHPWQREDVALELVRTIDYREVPGHGLVRLYRGTRLVPPEAVTLEAVRRSILAAAGWYLANLQPDGSVTYKWWPSENRPSAEYNLVRHTLATWNLVAAWKLDPRPEYLEGARRALDFTLRWVRDEGEMSYLAYHDNVKLGSVAVGLLGMVDLARATGDHQWDELMRRFGRFVLFMQEPSGKFRPYYVPEGHPYYNAVNDIVPGEAALALIELAEYFDDPSYLDALPAYWSYYRRWWDERVKDRREGAPWPAYTYENDRRLELVQFGPWTVIAADAYHRVTGDQEVARFGLEIARWMIETYQWSQDRAPFPDYLGGYYKLPDELPAMQAFCYGEGTASAYELALRAAPEQAPYFERATRLTARFAFQLQYDPWNTYAFSRPWVVLGGIRYALNETKVRIDYVHHALSMLSIYLRAARRDPDLPPEVRGEVPLEPPEQVHRPGTPAGTGPPAAP